MLSLDQIKLLEAKVSHVVETNRKLTNECETLKAKLAEKNRRVSELENMVASFVDDQKKVEEGILSALNILSVFEDSASPVTSDEARAKPMTQKEKDLADILGTDKKSEQRDKSQPDIF